MRLPLVLLLLCLVSAPAAGQDPTALDRELEAFLEAVEEAVASGTPERYLDLVAPSADREAARQFARENLRQGVTRAAVRERDRMPVEGEPAGRAYRLFLAVFTESGREGRIATWRVDVRRGEEPDDRWAIAQQERLTNLEGLYRLALDEGTQFAVRDLTVSAEDLTLRMARGSAFVASVADGVTALVLRGRGEIVFSPAPEAERMQVRIFAGRETLRTRFDAAFVRLNPFELRSRVSMGSLVEREVNARDFRQAAQIFEEHVGQTFSLELGDLSPAAWSLVPAHGDFLAEVRTRRFGTLTYARSTSEAEDISLFHRENRRHISLYASAQKLAARGRFYNEDDLLDYEVLDYNVDTTFSPDRHWVQGRTTLRLKARAPLGTVTLRLAEPLAVHWAASDEFGRLLHLRVRGQNSVIVGLPSAVARGAEFSLTLSYAGRLPPQELEREALAMQSPQRRAFEGRLLPLEPRHLYSTRAHWYPQAPITGYATATLRLTVPAEFTVVASGEAVEGTPVELAADAERPARRLYVFVARQPVRYLACVISRLALVESGRHHVAGAGADAAEPGADGLLTLRVKAQPRQQTRARDLSVRALAIMRFYASLVDDLPYPSFTLALTESDLPGGHSPAYFAVLNQPQLPAARSWAADPVSFENYPDFFLAHELAHQWWGQAVGWKNYHEQWLSEGLAQYFTALYARHDRGEDVFHGILRQMRRSAMDHTAQGPVDLGYRLGHIRGDGRVFRALVYNKAALVLHMLRRLVGEEAFFAGLRRFYAEHRFRKAGADDLRRAFEAEAGLSLERFFERWIHGAGVPELRFDYRVVEAGGPGGPEAVAAGDAAGPVVVLRFEQEADVYDLPVTVTLTDAAGASHDVVVAVTAPVTELRVPLRVPLRRVEVNGDHAALAHIRR